MTSPIDLNARVEPATRENMARWYRDLADANRALGLHDLAQDCETKAAEMEYGGTIALEVPG